MLIAIFFTPSLSAIFRASPFNSKVGRPPRSRVVSMSTHRTPRLQPVPNAFIAASFTANRPAYRSYLSLNCSQYSLSSSVKIRRKKTLALALHGALHPLHFLHVNPHSNNHSVLSRRYERICRGWPSGQRFFFDVFPNRKNRTACNRVRLRLY